MALPPRLGLRWLARISVTVTVSAAVACSAERHPTDPNEQAPPAEAYLSQLIQIMETNSINRKKIDWDAFRTAVYAEAADAWSIQDAYPAIRTALALLGDGHSFYRPTTGATIFVPTRTCGMS